MENPLSGVMEWYQGLPQAAQIGIPVVGVGAVYLIAKGGKGGGAGGQVVAGPFGASSGGGSGSGGNTPPPSPSPKPKPKPVPSPHPVRPPVRPPHPKPGPGNHKPKPPGSGHFGGRPLPPVRPKAERPGAKAINIARRPGVPGKAAGRPPASWTGSHPHLPSSHIQSHPLGIASQHGSTPQVNPYTGFTTSLSKATAVGYTPPNKGGTPIVNAATGFVTGETKKRDIHPVQGIASHPINQRALANRVPSTKAHQHRNDQNRLAVNTLTQHRGIHQAGKAL